MPTPEELGIRLRPVASVLNWDQLRTKLDQIGARDFQLDKCDNGYRFSCRLPSGMVEGFGSSEGEAVDTALAKVQK